MSLKEKQERVKHANALLRVISDQGRRFFYNPKFDRVAFMEVDARGRVWFHDEYSGKRIYTHETTFGGRWRGFTHGGTLRNLIEWIRDYIRTGQRLPRGLIVTPQRFTTDGSNIWGYSDEAAAAVRSAAFAMHIIEDDTARAALSSNGNPKGSADGEGKAC